MARLESSNKRGLGIQSVYVPSHASASVRVLGLVMVFGISTKECN